jgi:amicoumacin kinase
MIPVPKTVAASLARSFGITAAELSHFGGGREDSDGIVYAYPFGATRRLLKVMAIPAEGQRRGLLCLEERLRFMRFCGENGASIAFPLFSPQGRLYEMFASEAHLWVGYAMDMAPGKTPKVDDWNPAFFRNWGQAIGRLHRLARQYPSWEASTDPDTGEAFLTWREEWEGFHQWCQDEEVRQKWTEIGRLLESLPRTRESFGFVHNDPHIYNLLADGDEITLLDFDVANYHWFVSDVAIACQSVLFSISGGMERPVSDRMKLLAFLACFMEGYEREHLLAPEWLDWLDLFIAYRRILLFIAMRGWLQSKPEVLSSWKQMILSQPEVVGVCPPR